MLTQKNLLEMNYFVFWLTKGWPEYRSGLWIRIQRLCGSRSVLGIRIRIQGQENEEISVERCTF
jgi:hypothetical protein